MNDLNLNDLHLKGEGADISDHLSHIKEFNQGSLTLRFRSESLSSDLTSLFSISNANLENNYFALYYQNSTGKLGIEFRDETGKHIINTSGHKYPTMPTQTGTPLPSLIMVIV
ncbi:sialidase domain-containing protein [Erysipelothrix piscisicarius]|uniref:sialidase domain-containing protein n=1 Tax=Erysipelothrix piscisicarius TaxID=2485784 RepID=UPI002F94B437